MTCFRPHNKYIHRGIKFFSNDAIPIQCTNHTSTCTGTGECMCTEEATPLEEHSHTSTGTGIGTCTCMCTEETTPLDQGLLPNKQSSRSTAAGRTCPVVFQSVPVIVISLHVCSGYNMCMAFNSLQSFTQYDYYYYCMVV